MKTLTEVMDALLKQKEKWHASSVVWSDFDPDFETGNKKHEEAIKDDFLVTNDVVELFEPVNRAEIGTACQLQILALNETLQEMDLT